MTQSDLFRKKVVLSLCDLTGIASMPWTATHDVICADIQSGQNIVTDGIDSILRGRRPDEVDVIIAQPPCTHFASSGSRWWASKGDTAILEGLQVVDACMRYVYVCKPRVFILEQPVGRLPKWIGPPVMRAHPWEYAMYSDDPEDDAYTKKTCLYGHFNIPPTRPWEGDVDRTKIHYVSPGPERANIRSKAPTGLWQALYEWNKEARQ